jgi:dUTP pyrophosphatase
MKTRGFEKISDQKDNPNVVLPKRQTPTAVCYDLVSPIQTVVPAKSFVKIPIGIKVYFQDDEVFHIYARSGLGSKHGITLRNDVAVFESDYYNNEGNEGEIIITLANDTDTDFPIEQGMRIAQGMFQKFLVADNDEVVTQKREGGLGSTGLQ